jgi:ribonuclease P protein component
MLARKNLIPLKKEFGRIRSSAKSYNSDSFGLLVSYHPLASDKLQMANDMPQCAFIVSKKISLKSVVRHAVKRKLADAVAPHFPHLPKNIELVFLAKQKAVELGSEEIKNEMAQLFKRTRLA